MGRVKVPLRISLCMAILHQENGVPIKDIVRKYPRYSKSSIYRHCKYSLTYVAYDKRKDNKGRPPILSARDERKLIRELYKL